jgi:hypothetical protein
MRRFANARFEPGYVAVYADKIYILDSDTAFARFLTDNKLQISASTKDHLSIALECSVLGWTSHKKRIDSWQDLEAEALTLTSFFKKRLYKQIEPPYFGETSTTNYLAIWMYHSDIQDMLVRWVASQSKEDISEVHIIRDVQIVAAGVD